MDRWKTITVAIVATGLTMPAHAADLMIHAGHLIDGTGGH